MEISHRSKAVFGLVVGVAALSALAVWQGIAAVVGLLTEAGYALLFLCLFALPVQMLAAESWRSLLSQDEPPARWLTLFTSWMGSAVDTLLPVASVGGEVVKARVLIHWGQPPDETIAAAAVDKTVRATAILVWGLIAAGFLGATVGQLPTLNGVLVCIGLLLVGIAGFAAVQLWGGLSRIAARTVAQVGADTGPLQTSAAAVEVPLRSLYRDIGRFTHAVMLRVGQRLFLAAEVVLAGILLGQPVGIADAIVLIGLIGVLRGLFFAVPAGLGVQECGYALVGVMLGYSPDLMIAISLSTRLREILPDLPLLLVCLATERRALWARRQAPSRQPPDEAIPGDPPTPDSRSASPENASSLPPEQG